MAQDICLVNFYTSTIEFVIHAKLSTSNVWGYSEHNFDGASTLHTRNTNKRFGIRLPIMKVASSDGKTTVLYKEKGCQEHQVHILRVKLSQN